MVSFIKKESSDDLARATIYSTESRKLQKSTKHNAMNRAHMTYPWGQSLRNRPDAAPLHPNQVKVDRKMEDGEGRWAGGCRERFFVGE